MNNETVNLQFSLNSDNFRLLEQDNYCSIAEVDFLHVGVNRNMCDISKECVNKSLDTFYNKPLLCILDNKFLSSLADFKEHARNDNDKKNFIAFGTIPESSTFRFVERDNGKLYLSAKVVIWKRYFPVIMDILKRRNGEVKVSIELAVVDGFQDEETGILNIKEFKLLSCVLLGEGIMEGIEGSHLEVLQFSLKDDFKKANEYYLTFAKKNNKYEIPDYVQNSIQEGLNGYKSIGKGCTTQEVALAKKLATDTYIDAIHFSKLTEKMNAVNKNKTLVFDLLGGEITNKWIESIVNEGVVANTMKSLSNDELQDQIIKELSKYKYHDGKWEGLKYYVTEIYSSEKVIIVRDNETAKYYKIEYKLDNNNVILDMDKKALVHRTYEEVRKDFAKIETVMFSKAEYGTGEEIEIDKSKDSLSDKSWGSINKTELRKKVLQAKNYKTLVKAVYLVVEEGWEDAPSSKLKYPIMEIKDGKAVYNRYGLASALGYAEANNETAVVNKVKSLYKKLDIDNKDEGGEKEMAKELDKEKVVDNKVKEEIDNKLDKDNKDIEKIRDDAEAQEDDVKEEDKKEIKNSDKCDDLGFADKVKKNEIEKDDEGEEDLEDDVDSDKDYWKEKANALEIKNAEIEKELSKYKREEEERKMAAEVDKFAHCMSDEEAKELKNAIKDITMAEMKEKINSKVADFALKLKNKEKEDKELTYSINPMFEMDSLKFSKNEIKNLDDIISNSSANIAGKR